MNTGELCGPPPRAGNAMLARLPSRLLRRPDLERLLGCWASMTLVRGPQGYGKTTLVVSWLERLDAAVIRVWVNAGPDLDERQRFWRHVLRCFPPGEQHPSSEPPAPESGDPWRALETRLRSLHARRVVLVVDRFDGIRDRDVIGDLAQLAQRQRNLHVYVCVRGRHPLETVGPAYTELATIGPADLLLSVAQIRQLGEVLGRPVSDAEAAAVHGVTGGWVAPSRRVLEASPPERLDPTLAEEYLRTTVLPHIGDRDTLRGLMRLCLLERPPVRLVHDLYGVPDAFLAALGDLGLPDLDHRRDGERLRIPPLLRTVLRDEFTRDEPDEATAFHQVVGRWFAERAQAGGGDTDGEGSDADAVPNAVEALRHLAAAGAWEEVARWWSVFGPRLLTTRPHEARRVLACVPEPVARRHPRLRIGRAILTALAGGTGDDLAAALRAYADTSEHIVRQSAGALSLPDLLSAGSGYLYGQRAKGHLAAAERFAADLQDRVERHGGGVPDADLAWLQVQCGLVHTLRGDDAAAIRCYRRAWERGGGAGRIAGPSAAGHLAMTHALRGDREQALLWLGRYGEPGAGGRWVHRLVGLGARIARGALALDELDQPRASGELACLRAQAADLELWPFVAFLDAVHGLHFGDPAAALGDLAAAARAWDGAAERGAAWVLHSRITADLLMACGEGNRALQVIDTLRSAAADPATDAGRVVLARLHLLSGDHHAAGALAAGLLDHRDRWERDHLELLLIRAVSASRLGDRDTAARLFAHAVGRYRRNRVLRAFATVPPDDLGTLVEQHAGLLSAEEAAALAAVRPVFTAPVGLVRLTRQEQRVLAELERSRSNKDIADALYVSVSTVKTQLHAIYRKLGTTTRKETILRAHELMLLPPRPTPNADADGGRRG